MILDEIPDYSKYTLRDLYDAAREIDSIKFPNSYVRALVEIERRGAKLPSVRTVRPVELKPTPKRAIPLYSWLLKPSPEEHTAANIADWWGKRWAFWFGFVATLYFSSCATMGMLLVFGELKRNPTSFDKILTEIPAFLGIAMFGFFYLQILLNILYWLMCFLDLLLSLPLRFLGWRLSVGVFAALLVITVLVAAYSIVSLMLQLLQN